MSTPAITIKNLAKAYRIGEELKGSDTLWQALVSIIRSPLNNLKQLKGLKVDGNETSGIHWALKDLNLEVKAGEVLGIIGHNGAGKSTLLKILSRITPPTRGRVDIEGRVSSLLEVGTGFHPELSGRDNIYMNGTLLGMKKKEIDGLLSAIIEFSGIGKYIDTPVKWYSSGMKVRLAFAVAAHLEPEILIIDEVLAVGDAAFQKKCLGKMESVASHGRTVLFVSHDMGAVKSLCTRVVLLKNGEVQMDGDPDTVIAAYLLAPDSNASIQFENQSDRLSYTGLTVKNSTGQATDLFSTGHSIEFEMTLNGSGPIEAGTNFYVFLKSNLGVKIAVISTKFNDTENLNGDNIRKVSCRIPSIPLLKGNYRIDLVIKQHEELVCEIQDACTFNIESGNYPSYHHMPTNTAGPYVIENYWTVKS